jgi:O-antigen/teichoic acid export membrane protein
MGASEGKSARLSGQLVLNGVSVMARLFAGVILFIFMARAMGPEPFGLFMYAMSAATILAFPAQMGFGQQVLREVAASPPRALGVIATITRLKLLLSVGMLVVAAGIGIAGPTDGQLVALLMVAALSDSFTEYLFCVQRAKGQFAREAGFMTIVSLGHLGITLLALQWTLNPALIALVFSGSKLGQLMLAWRLFSPSAGQAVERPSAQALWLQLKAGMSYAGDSALQTLSNQIDTIILRHTLGAHATGIYQSGMRVVAGLQNFSVVAGNVFIPRLASVHQQPARFKQEARKATLVFGGLAALCALAMLIGGMLLVNHGYGEQYQDMMHLLPYLAGLIGLRLLAASQGVQLTALGEQRFRTWVNSGALVLIISGIWIGSAQWGIQGAIAALCLVTLFIHITYWARIQRLKSTA